MTTDPITIDANASIEEAIQTMETSGVRHLPVLKDKYLVRVISDRDLAKVIQDSSSEKLFEVNEVMSPSPYTAFPEEEMKNVLQVIWQSYSPRKTLPNSIQIHREYYS